MLGKRKERMFESEFELVRLGYRIFECFQFPISKITFIPIQKFGAAMKKLKCSLGDSSMKFVKTKKCGQLSSIYIFFTSKIHQTSTVSFKLLET